MLIEFGKAGWIEKARQQPEKVRQVLDKIRTDGLLPTIDAVRSKLDQPIPLGYSNVGVFMETADSFKGEDLSFKGIVDMGLFCLTSVNNNDRNCSL